MTQPETYEPPYPIGAADHDDTGSCRASWRAYVCTRRDGHDGRHEAGMGTLPDGEIICAAWPNEAAGPVPVVGARDQTFSSPPLSPATVTNAPTPPRVVVDPESPAVPDEAYEAAKEAMQARGWICEPSVVCEPSVIRAALAAAVPALHAAWEAEIRGGSPAMQYLTTYNCDGTAAHWKRKPVVPRQTFSWEPATEAEIASADYRCRYCASVFDGPAQCHIYDECSRFGVAARGAVTETKEDQK